MNDDEKLDRLEEALGVNLKGTQAVANNTKQYFAEQCEEHDLDVSEMMTAWRAANEQVEESFGETLGGGDGD